MDFGLTIIREAHDGAREALCKDTIRDHLESLPAEVSWAEDGTVTCEAEDGGIVDIRAAELLTDEPLLAIHIDLWDESLTEGAFAVIAGLIEVAGAGVKDRLSGEFVEYADSSELLAKTSEVYEQYLAFFGGE